MHQCFTDSNELYEKMNSELNGKLEKRSFTSFIMHEFCFKMNLRHFQHYRHVNANQLQSFLGFKVGSHSACNLRNGVRIS